MTKPKFPNVSNEDNLLGKTTSKYKKNVEYLSNHWSDHTQILKVYLDDITKVYECFKWWWTPIEDDLKI